MRQKVSSRLIQAIVADDSLTDETLAPRLPAADISQLKDVAAPVAIYCADSNINIWKINAETGEGTLIITTPQVEGTPEGGNTELASAEGVTLYWLEGGQYQINTPNFEGKPYVITWEGCDASSLAHLAPQP